MPPVRTSWRRHTKPTRNASCANHPCHRLCLPRPGSTHPGKQTSTKPESRRQLGTVASLGGSGGNRRLRLRIVGWVEFLSVARTKRTIVDGTANLEEEIGPSPRPAHGLRFVHPPIAQEIGRHLRDRGTNPQAGTVPLGVIDHPVALAGEIAIQRVQGGP